MIPYNPELNTTVIVYNHGRFIGQRYGKWSNLEQIKQMVNKEKWMQPGEPTQISVVQDHGYKIKVPADNYIKINNE